MIERNYNKSSLDRFRELILMGKKRGKLIVPLSNGNHISLRFDRNHENKFYFLQAYYGHTFLWCSWSIDHKHLVIDYDELLNEYLCIE